MKRELFFLPGFLGFVILVMAQSIYTPLVEAQAQPRQLICPLSDSQQERSQQAFQQIYDMITSDPPRCINCHGKVQPFANNTTHEGGKQDPVFKKGKLLVFIDPQGEPIKDATQTFASSCILCHEPPFFPPRPVAFWVGRTPIQLCEQFKKRFNNDASRFLDHVRDDEFAAIGFEGTRGLNDNGKLFAIKSPYKAEPPSFSKAEYHVYTNAWIDAQGGKFKGDFSCGCEPHHYVLKGSFNEVWTKEEGPLHFKGDGELQIPIKFSDDGSFNGETAIDVSEANKWTLEPMSCSETVSYSGVTWKVKGSIADGGEMQITVLVQFPPSEMTTVCTAGGITTTNSLPNIRPEQSMNFNGSVAVGETFTVEDPYPQGGSLKAQFTIEEEEKK